MRRELLRIQKFKFVNKVDVFMTCQIKTGKKKQAAFIGVKYSQKASHAELVKNVQAAEKGMSARLCTEIDRKDYWLTVLTNVMESLFSKINITRDTKGTDQITERLFQIDNIKLKINTQSNHIIDYALVVVRANC